jgi:hypothetical protein
MLPPLKVLGCCEISPFVKGGTEPSPFRKGGRA